MPTVGVRRGGGGEGAVRLRITNLNEWLRAMESTFKDAIDEAEPALEKALDRFVFQPSQVLCPISKDGSNGNPPGFLRASGHVEVSRTESDRLVGAVVYDADYAIYVHEIPTAHHEPPTQWKFVEVPFVENADLVAEAVLDAVFRELDQ